MSLTEKDVAKIAKLSRLYIPEADRAKTAQQLNSIFNWIEQLMEVDVEGVEPMAGVGNYTLRLRKDEVTDGEMVKDVLSNAPKASFDCYVVPKVVDQG